MDPLATLAHLDMLAAQGTPDQEVTVHQDTLDHMVTPVQHWQAILVQLVTLGHQARAHQDTLDQVVTLVRAATLAARVTTAVWVTLGQLVLVILDHRDTQAQVDWATRDQQAWVQIRLHP
jgi:hypothetical protein